jgi:hypothetical protein
VTGLGLAAGLLRYGACLGPTAERDAYAVTALGTTALAAGLTFAVVALPRSPSRTCCWGMEGARAWSSGRGPTSR